MRAIKCVFPIHQRVPSQPIRRSRRLCPIVAYGSAARDAVGLMKDEIHPFHSPAGRDDGNKTLLDFLLWRIDLFQGVWN